MIDIIKEKLGRYGATNALEEENALKEILQEIALYALWRADFFDCALFQGGTSLRILHGLPRFCDRRRVHLEGHPSSLYREFRNIAEEHISEGYRDHAQSGDRGIHPEPSPGRDHIFLPIHAI